MKHVIARVLSAVHVDCRSVATVTRSLELMIEATVTCASPKNQAVVLLVARSPVEPPSASVAAVAAALSSRYAMARSLTQAGLPSYRELISWVRVLYWLLVWEREKTSLLVQALRTGLEPSVCYRTVRRTLGVAWSTACAQGSSGCLLRLRTRLDELAGENRLGLTQAGRMSR